MRCCRAAISDSSAASSAAPPSASRYPRPGRTGDGTGLDVTRTRHIVIVDDEPNIGRSLRLILEHEGYRVTVCESAATFHAERRRGRADLYLLDVRLPDGNGIDLLRAVRQSDETTPVVMISGHGTIRDAVADAKRRVRFSRSRSRATGSCSSRSTPSSDRICSARTSDSASWSATRPA